MRSAIEAYYEIGDAEYTVTVEEFTPPSRPSYHDPGDGGEVFPAQFVSVRRRPDGVEPVKDVVTWDTFLRDYAAALGKPSDKVESEILDELMEKACEDFSDMYDGCDDRSYNDE